MYTVIFRAEMNELDAEQESAYLETVERMRELAINDFDCKEFSTCNEGKNEISISYWENESQIKTWKQNAEHLLAQQAGKSKWYKSYSVQITKIVREYSYD